MQHDRKHPLKIKNIYFRCPCIFGRSGCRKILQGFLVFNHPLMAKKIIYKNSQWRVDHSGNLICDQFNYQISKETLTTFDWLNHLQDKNWVDVDLFKRAFRIALKNTTNG